jgi:hypothetical protein
MTQNPHKRPLSTQRSTRPDTYDPAQSLYSASRLLHTAASVRTGAPERQ